MIISLVDEKYEENERITTRRVIGSQGRRRGGGGGGGEATQINAKEEGMRVGEEE